MLQHVYAIEAIINAVREAVIANPHTNMSSIRCDLQLDHTKVYRNIKTNLSWHLKDVQHKDYFSKICLIEKLFVIGFQNK